MTCWSYDTTKTTKKYLSGRIVLPKKIYILINAHSTISPTFVVIRGFLFFAYLAWHPLLGIDETELDDLEEDAATMPPKKATPARPAHDCSPKKPKERRMKSRSWRRISSHLPWSPSHPHLCATPLATSFPWLGTPLLMAQRKSSTLISSQLIFQVTFSGWPRFYQVGQGWSLDWISEVVLRGGLSHGPTWEQFQREWCSCPVS